jgi:hypothetical protein
MIELRKMRWAGHIASTSEERRKGNAYKRDYLKDLGIAEIIILNLNLKKYCGVALTGFVWLRIGISDRLL